MSLLRSRETVLFLAIVFLLALIASRFPEFLALSNLVNVFTDTSPLIILVMGQMLVILTRCIDLSVAANLALTGMACAMINVAFPGLPPLLIALFALVLGGALGAINGLLVWRLAIPSIVVTLGTMTIFRGMIFLLTEGQWINAHEMSPAFKQLPRTEFLQVPLMAWTALSVVIGIAVLLYRSALGRSFFAVGGNPQAAVYTGLHVGRSQCWAFVICGALAGLSGYLWVARYAVAYVDIAAGFELDVVAACVIGGISIAGGAGTVVGALLGALFLGVVRNALPVVDISPFWQLAISGAAILAAVTFNAPRQGQRGRLILKPLEASS